jgi:cyclic pyranopterin phosphate synthase
MPEHPTWMPAESLLSPEELEFLARIFVQKLGIQRIRLTGGEPLIRHDVIDITKRLASLKSSGLQRLSMTTNGTRLPRLAQHLSDAGLDDVNVSIDALDAEIFRAITGNGDVRRVLDGIQAARSAGLGVKLNAVIIRSLNESQVLPLVDWAYNQGVAIRFIEFMPLDSQGVWKPEQVLTHDQILRILQPYYELSPVLHNPSDPARYYLLNNSVSVGVIPTVSNPFCEACDRIRITADGKLLACLFSASGYDLKQFLRHSESEAPLIDAIRRCVDEKWAGYVALQKKAAIRHLPMHAIGG